SFMIPPPPQPTLFPYTTLFRSPCHRATHVLARHVWVAAPPEGGVDRPGADRAGAGGRHHRRGGDPGVDEPLGPESAPERPESERSEEHTFELQSRGHLVCRLLL